MCSLLNNNRTLYNNNNNNRAYNTAIDIKLRKWNEVVLQQKSVDVAYETMTEQFASLLKLVCTPIFY